MFQKSLLKNFVKSFNTPDFKELLNFVTKDRFIAEDANGAEFINLLAKFLHWQNYKRELKNKTDRKKADGVIFNKKDEPIAIIELKSSDKDISNPDIIAQAFRYKNEKPTCRYVFISNFKQIDIYCDSSDKSFKIDLTDKENYPILYALLNQTSLETDEIAKLKANSKSQEQITKEVYKIYSNFRLKLLNNIAKNNNLSKLEALEVTNKLLDRFMFILFAEDRGLIPPNSIDKIIKQYENSKKWDEEIPLYYYYKKYFHFIDKGNDKINIPRYNGNLFKTDNTLENLIIDDQVIKDDLAKLSAYDFSLDADVEVLGHIFEQSLNDLEELKKSFTNDKIQNKRKKEGVFYTPKYITEYIIKNTIGKLCESQKERLNLYKVPTTKKDKSKRIEKLHQYREFLEKLKIVDPACGSGAFLNASFRYLLDEHRWIQKELSKNGANLFEQHNIDKQIIENNLYGVDINSASVGITKLSLWLQTAKRGRTLSNLANNIKNANSLTADWSELFPEIIKNGGFDAVIGNPPYVRQESIKELKPMLKNYNLYSGTADLYVYFYELAQKILKDGGFNGFICSNKFFRAKYGEKLREMILTKTIIHNIVDFTGVKVFEDASVDSAITILQKGFSKNNIFKVSLNGFKTSFEMFQNDLSSQSFTFASPDELAIKAKIEKIGMPLKKWDVKIYRGILTGLNEAFIIDTKTKDEILSSCKSEDERDRTKRVIKPILRGRDIKRYAYEWAGLWVIGTFPALHLNIEDYPVIKKYLEQFLPKLKQTGETFIDANGNKQKTRKKTGNKWFETQDQIAYYDEFEKEKIAWQRVTKEPTFCLVSNGVHILDSMAFITSDFNRYLLAVLNSKVLAFYIDKITHQYSDKGYLLSNQFVERLPIPKIPKERQKPFINSADAILDAKEKIAKYKKHFDSLSAKDKIEIKEEIEKLKNLVNENIEKIDSLVYELYDLNSDEIKIIKKGGVL